MVRDRTDALRNACLSCRQRKLKCDKAHPCANCVARAVECRQQQLQVPSGRGVRKPREMQADGDNRASSPSTLSSILARLESIEAAIGRPGLGGEPRTPVSSFPSHGSEIRPDHARSGSTPISPQTVADTTEQTRISDAFRTESGRMVSMHANDDALLGALSTDLAVSVSGSTTTSPASDHDHGIFGSRPCELPPIQETYRLLKVHMDYIGVFQRILYAPHVLQLIDSVYSQVLQGSSSVAPRGTALIFSFLASGVLSGPIHGTLEYKLPIIKERLKACAKYIASAMDCLEQARRRMDHTLENVQALIVLGFLINHIEAFSPRNRVLFVEAVAVARVLGFHQLDSTLARRGQLTNEDDFIVRETKRRAWWYITAMDWIVTLAGAPGDGIYLIQNKHLVVNLPLHVDDEDLCKPDVKEKPLSEPTDMSYIRHRLLMAEIARDSSDMLPLDPNLATYDLIISLDSRLEAFLESLPIFFQMDKAQAPEVRQIDCQRPYIPIQRAILAMMINLGRCKLHLPYMIGSPDGALHSFSRAMCLRSAHAVLSGHDSMTSTNLSHSAEFMRTQGTTQLMFIGALILATDLCCNRPTGDELEQGSAALMKACNMLASLKLHSQIAAKFLDSLTEMLVRYGVWAPSEAMPLADEPKAPVAVQDFTQQWQLGNNSLELRNSDMPLYFDDLWQRFVDQPSMMDMIDFV